MKAVVLACIAAAAVYAQSSALSWLVERRPIVDAHNSYPYEGQWADRLTRALSCGMPVGIEQDLAWATDPKSGQGRAVVSHNRETNGSEPSLRDYFFETVRPIVEKALREGDRASWPLIVLHFDFKDNRPELHDAVWSLLGEFEPWITTAVKTDSPDELAPFDVKPLLVLTEDNDAQEEAFFTRLPKGARLRLFGSAHTNGLQGASRQDLAHWAATAPPDKLLTDRPTNYRRWWNNSWAEVEEGGQKNAAAWTEQDRLRLRALVDHAHNLGFWIRFYTLDGFSQENSGGWDQGYNFGSPEAVKERWKAAIEARVDLIATDQYEDLTALLRTLQQ